MPVCAAFPGGLQFYSVHQAYQNHSARPDKSAFSSCPPMTQQSLRLCLLEKGSE